jgi:hypothetical protein
MSPASRFSAFSSVLPSQPDICPATATPFLTVETLRQTSLFDQASSEWTERLDLGRVIPDRPPLPAEIKLRTRYGLHLAQSQTNGRLNVTM